METEVVSRVFDFGWVTSMENNLVTTLHQVNPSIMLFGSYPGGMHLVDLRQRNSLVESAEIPTTSRAPQATPLCIRHRDTGSHEFLVCGWFPSILVYDLRNGLRISDSVYSGANVLSHMTTISKECIIAGGTYRGLYLLPSYLMISQDEVLWNV